MCLLCCEVDFQFPSLHFLYLQMWSASASLLLQSIILSTMSKSVTMSLWSVFWKKSVMDVTQPTCHWNCCNWNEEFKLLISGNVSLHQNAEGRTIEGTFSYDWKVLDLCGIWLAQLSRNNQSVPVACTICMHGFFKPTLLWCSSCL